MRCVLFKASRALRQQLRHLRSALFASKLKESASSASPLTTVPHPAETPSAASAAMGLATAREIAGELVPNARAQLRDAPSRRTFPAAATACRTSCHGDPQRPGDEA